MPAGRDAQEPPRDLRYPSKEEDPAWRAWYLRSIASRFPPPGRPTLDGQVGTTVQVSVKVPAHLRARAQRLARWRGSTVGAVVRSALEHYLDEGVGGRAAMPRPGRHAPPTGSGDHPFDVARAYADADEGTVAEEE